MPNTDGLQAGRFRPASGRAPALVPAASTGLAFAWVIASLVLLGILAAGGLSVWMMIGRQATTLQQQTANTNLLEQTVRAIEQAASDVDGDGTLEAPAFQSGTFIPVGGGNLPSTIGATKSDAYGHLLGYCSWDHGNSTSSTNRIAGDNSPLQSDVVFAVISAGKDGVFQTSCANLKTGTVNGDDEARPLTLAELHQAVGGNVFMGEPVASQSALASINSPKTGELHLAKDTNTLYQWNGSAWNSIGTTTAPTLPGKNLLINGNFDIWQRGTSFTVAANSNSYTADRWDETTNTTSMTVSRFLVNLADAPRPSFATYGMKLTVPANNTQSGMLQKIEIGVAAVGKTYTFSFWAKSDTTGWTIQPKAIMHYGDSSGWPTPSADWSTAGSNIALTTAWQRYSFSFTVPSGTFSSNPWLAVQVATVNAVGSGATVNMYFAQAQVEEGTSATAYDLRPVGQELYDCMRYYEVYTTAGTSASPDYSGYVDGSGNPIIRNIQYRVPKRTTPSVTLVGSATGSNLSGTGFSVNSPGTLGFQLQIWGTSAGMVTASQSWTADAEF